MSLPGSVVEHLVDCRSFSEDPCEFVRIFSASFQIVQDATCLFAGLVV